MATPRRHGLPSSGNHSNTVSSVVRRAAYAQLRMTSALADDLRRPWQPKAEEGTVLSPYRTWLGFRRLRARLGSPAKSTKFSRPGPGRPKGSKNRPKAPCPPHRKSIKADTDHEK